MSIDLRSDTVTRPTEAMRRAMAAAEVGDDIYGEDPTARRLEERAAEVLGKEAAIFVPSGTMGNQLALLLHCRPGDDVVIGEHAHVKLYESGAAGALAGVQFTVAGAGGLFTAEELDAALYPTHAYYMPRTRLVAFENTHNRAGGVVWPQAQAEAVAAHARSLGLGTHLDGARIWNAAAASGRSPAALAAPFDTVSACFSKGLGAPVGSVLAASKARVEEARRFRKMLGGAMRQVGVVCAGALHALEHHVERVVEDHGNARTLAEGLAALDGVSVDLEGVQTNIVNFDLDDAPSAARRAGERGVLVSAIGPSRIRAVTHLDVSPGQIEEALGVFREVIAG
ncbi:MAG TPA: GntG family PLP-dependent aldolase [Sandaracinaceae bacterium LLY-WYZ-13_1]|nr:GntG family PLP-dependent aldolase [Sandaracinaceae bacterium LLY-WYZ-13_1]